MMYNLEALWVSVLRGKYLAGGEVNFLTSKKTLVFLTWRAIIHHAAILSNNIGQSIDNGRKIKFWMNNQVNDIGPLLNVTLNPGTVSNIQATISKFITNGDWNWN